MPTGSLPFAAAASAANSAARPSTNKCCSRMPDPSDHPFDKRRWRFDLADLAPLLTLGLLVMFFSLTGRKFFHPFTITQVLEQGAVMGIVAAGLTFVLLCGEIDLSVGNMALWTACLCGVLYEL